MKRVFSIVVICAVSAIVITKFMPEIRAFYDDTLGGCIEKAKRVAKLHEERNKETEAILDNIN
jgi:hypothetical protein